MHNTYHEAEMSYYRQHYEIVCLISFLHCYGLVH